MTETDTGNGVLAPGDIVWNKLDKSGFPGVHFWFSQSVIDADYTGLFSAQLCKIGPGGRSRWHIDHYNHAFLFTSGTGRVDIGEHSWGIVPGTVVKIRAGNRHSLSNTGAEDLAFLVVYDPPFVAGAQSEKTVED
jgi:mannose-6-phosphate isomerase-like protein (cupin superfamily)